MDDLTAPAARWPLGRIGAAFAAVAAGLVLARSTASPEWSDVVACALAYAGAIVAGAGVAVRHGDLKTTALAAVTSYLAALGTHPDWFGIRIVFEVAAGVAVAGAVLVAVPRPVALGAISLIAVFHFCGVLTAIWSPSPSPWLVTQLWTRVFRFHLLFCYVNNAYQFYSPDPGPAALLWFCVESHDGDKTWFKLPRKPETRLDPMGVQYFRRLSITSACNQLTPITDVPDFVKQRRTLRSDVPLHPMLPIVRQYRLPIESSRKVIGSCARHVADMYGGRDRVKVVKVYIVEHRMLSPQEYAERFDPYDKTTYWPFFMGDHDADGRLIDSNDPLLHWLIPIVPGIGPVSPERPGEEPFFNGLKHHTGLDPFAA